MAINIHDAFMPIYLSTLRATLHILIKSTTHLQPASTPSTEQKVLDLRLAPDMNNLTFQITNLCAIARNLIIIVSSSPSLPPHVSYPETMSGLKEELQSTIALLESVGREKFEGRDEAVVEVKALGKKMRGLAYVQEFGVVNLGFHASMVYALFRKEGAPLGKWDYLKGGQ